MQKTLCASLVPCRRAGKGQGGPLRRTDPWHSRRGHVLWSVKGLCRVKMLTCLKKAKASFPRGSPCSFTATFPSRVFHSFLNSLLIFITFLKASPFLTNITSPPDHRTRVSGLGPVPGQQKAEMPLPSCCCCFSSGKNQALQGAAPLG